MTIVEDEVMLRRIKLLVAVMSLAALPGCATIAVGHIGTGVGVATGHPGSGALIGTGVGIMIDSAPRK
jgi:hypothetical protein